MLKGRDIPYTNRLERIRHAVLAVRDGASDAMAVGESAGIGARHAGYALHAARVLGWIAEADDGTFSATDSGRRLLRTLEGSEEERRVFRSAVASSTVVRALAPTLLEDSAPELDTIAKTIVGAVDFSDSTARQRGQTLLAWRQQVMAAETSLSGPDDEAPSLDLSAEEVLVTAPEPTLMAKTRQMKVRELVELKRDGKLFLPDLQRSFVWNNERVRALHDSLYRRYPIGVLLLWKPIWEQGEPPLCTRSWDLCPPNAVGEGTPEQSPPVRAGAVFVLDGQQRLTSLFRVIFQNRTRGKKTSDPDLRVALSSDPKWTKEPFHVHNRSLHGQLKEGLVVPAEVLFAGIRGEGEESAAVQKAIEEWVKPGTDVSYRALDRANAIRSAVLNAEILAYEIDADVSDENVIELFARLNQLGVPLRPSDLASARLTGSFYTFRSRARESLAESAFRDFGGNDESDESGTGGRVDTDLLVRGALFLGTGMLRYGDVEKRRRAGSHPYAQVEANWDVAVGGLKDAVSILRNAGVPSGSWLPYRYSLLIPAIASARGKLHDTDWWLGWMIASSLWGHYSGSAETTAQSDAKLAEKAKYTELLESIMESAKRTDSVIPDETDFTQDIVRSDGVHLALLVNLLRKNGRSFPSGARFRPGAEDPVEIHHIFPRSFLNDEAVKPVVADKLGNLTPLFHRDNDHIKATPPAAYLANLVRRGQQEWLADHDIPEDPELWDLDRYNDFCEAREKRLARTVRELLQELLRIG